MTSPGAPGQKNKFILFYKYMLLPKNKVAPVASCGHSQNIVFRVKGQPQDFPSLARSLLRKLPYLSISVVHSV